MKPTTAAPLLGLALATGAPLALAAPTASPNTSGTSPSQELAKREPCAEVRAIEGRKTTECQTMQEARYKSRNDWARAEVEDRALAK